MSLIERIKMESQKIDTLDYYQNTCFSCKYWIHKIRKDSKYCHKCINNLELSIKGQDGYSLDGLRDYFSPAFNKKTKKNINSDIE